MIFSSPGVIIDRIY